MRPLLISILAGLTACTPAFTAPAPVVVEQAPFAVPALSPRPAMPRPAPAAMEAPEPREPGPELPAAPYLAPGAATRFAGRALLAKDGPLRFGLDGGPLTHGAPRALGYPVEGMVVEERPRSVRVVITDASVRLVVHVRRDALHAVSVRAVWLSPAAERAPDPTAGVHLAPGIPLAEKARLGALRQVAGEVGEVSFEGWLPGDAVGTVFVPERFPAPGATGLLAEGTAITAPGGEVLARLRGPASPSSPPGFHHDVTLLPGGPVGFQAVHLRRTGIEVRGLVPASAARKKPRGGAFGTGFGFGGVGGMSHSQRALLVPGAGIHTPEGERVGVAIHPTTVWVSGGSLASKERLVWATFVFSAFGFVDVQVRPADLRPAPPR